jgi:lysozyme family protein
MAKVNVATYIAANSRRWKNMHVRSDKVALIDRVARRLSTPDSKSRFKDIQRATGVPWPVVAVIKEREAGADPGFSRSIAQGDPWNRVSVHVPKGRGPFPSWRAAALDALVKCAPFAARWRDWTYGGALTLLIMYNGLGYDRRGLPSPYAWAATDQYKRGKYVRDGVFDPGVVDQQLGCAAILKRMGELDPDAKLKAESKKVETTAGTGATIGTATEEVARQSTEITQSGMPLSRVLFIIGLSIAAGIAVYVLVRWVRKNKPILVEHDEALLLEHAALAGADRHED